MVARSAFRVQCLNEKAATGSLKAILLVSITSLNSFFHSFCYISQFATDSFFLQQPSPWPLLVLLARSPRILTFTDDASKAANDNDLDLE